jgi:fanconi-associated nuclease 1
MLGAEKLFSKENRISVGKRIEFRKSLDESWDFLDVTTEQKYDRKFFKERHITWPRLKLSNDKNVGATYINETTKNIYGVEELALTFYCTKQGFKGIHSENGLGITLFGLLMWDQIFDNTVPGVFQSPFQYAPLDYTSQEFFFNRKIAILNRLKAIEEMTSEELRKEIETKWDANQYTHNWAINWDSVSYSKKKLMDVVYWIGGKILRKILVKYWKDYKNWNHGMPDLLLWNKETKEYKFSEVKSENDKLSEVQKGWIQYLSQIGVHVEVCYVNRKPEQLCEKVF